MIKFLQRLFSYLRRRNRQSEESKIEVKFKKRLDKIYRSNNSDSNLSDKIKALATKMKNDIRKKDSKKEDKIEELEEKELIKTELKKNLKVYKNQFESNGSNLGFFEAIKNLNNYIKEAIGKINYNNYKKREIIKELLLEELKGKINVFKTSGEKEQFINEGLDICAGELDVLKVLIEDFGADVSYKNKEKEVFLFKTASLPQGKEILEYIGEKYPLFLLTSFDIKGRNLLHPAVKSYNPGGNRNHEEVLIYLLEKKLDPFHKDKEEKSVMDLAKEKRHEKIVRLFEDKKYKEDKLKSNLEKFEKICRERKKLVEESKSFLKRSRSFSI